MIWRKLERGTSITDKATHSRDETRDKRPRKMLELTILHLYVEVFKQEGVSKTVDEEAFKEVVSKDVADTNKTRTRKLLE